MSETEKTREQLVAEMEQLERQLQESQALLSAVVECLPFAFFAIDRSGRYMMQNAACSQHCGDIVGKRPQDLDVDSEMLALWEDNNRRAFAGERVEGDVQLTLGGETKTYHNIITPIRLGDETLGILGVNIDVPPPSA